MIVTWQHQTPPLPATRWQAFEALSLGVSEPEDAALEKDLQWSLGTLALLRAAFGLKLSRQTGFVGTEGLTAAQLASIKDAARVYKRGVAFKDKVASTQDLPTAHQGSYEISFEVVQKLDAQLIAPNIFTIIDGNVARLWPELKALCQEPLILTLSEHEKSLASVAKILAAYQKSNKSQKSNTWQIIGGGILADTAMFAAALVGAEATLVPTTLLAMADACVGGKTGVNFSPYGKNQVGAFYFPKAVKIWTPWLRTLPPRELAAGAAECLKHAFLAGDLSLAQQLAGATTNKDLVAMTSLMPQIVKFKADVVARDPIEAGERAILNLGHTLGHALEAMSQAATQDETTILHGEAIGIGIAYAILLSELPTQDSDKMIFCLRQAGCLMTKTLLARRLGLANKETLATSEISTKIFSLMELDKKNTGQKSTIDWVLLAKPGEVLRGKNGEFTVPIELSSSKDVELNVMIKAWHELLRQLAD